MKWQNRTVVGISVVDVAVVGVAIVGVFVVSVAMVIVIIWTGTLYSQKFVIILLICK